MPPITASVSVDQHPERNVIRVQLAHNIVLKGMTAGQSAELEPLLASSSARRAMPC